MIAVPAGGRMGNQMFQFAFVYAASRRLATTFAFVAPRRASQRRELGPPLWHTFELGSWHRRALRLRREARLRLGGALETVDVGQHEEPGDVLARLRDGVCYRGYFQSERWFADYEDDVRRLFTVRGPLLAEFRARYEPRRPYVCMHVRRTDYLDTQAWALPTSYFHNALAAVPDCDRYELVVVSDDPEAVRRELHDLPVRCEARPAAVDLLLLTHATVVITSNSSFSWWGAWLNRRPGLRVIAPRHWFGFAHGVEEPARVIPSSWTTIDVRDPPLFVSPV
ncbi:MAG: alpha-1,2-fucosyltransferase [Solirubrobacteraceae bacterium]